jgi:hypothetical protein
MRRANGGPTKHHIERCVCGKKKSSYAQAKKEAKYLKYHKKYPDLRVMVYKCKKSGWWHVGNSL